MVVRQRVNRTRWREAVEALRTLCPVRRYTVTVRRCKIPADDDGDCRQIAKHKLMVRVNKNLSEPVALEVLAHEYAHALSWDIEHERSVSHSPFWGVAYAECYRAVFNPKE